MTDYAFAEQSHAGPETNTGRNSTGIPDRMKQDLESRSGLSFDDVRIHYNSGRPARFQSLAYTQGTNVYIAPGQEKHLRHELGHVIQQKQGLVRPAIRYENALLNNDPYLENQADRFAAGSFTGYPSGSGTRRFDIIQPKTEVTYSPGYYDYNYDFKKGGFQNRVTVGREMEAWLDPNDPITGSSASGEAHVHMHLLHYLKNKWGSSIIRGHLLNDHLGGLSVEENLFPISSNANKEHLNKIERFVKALVYRGNPEDAPAVHYSVVVLNEKDSQKFDEFHPITKFHCEVAEDLDGGVNAAYDVWSDVSDNTSNPDCIGPFHIGTAPHSNNISRWGTSRSNLAARPAEATEYTLTRSSGEAMADVRSSNFPFIGSVPKTPFSTPKGWGALSNATKYIPSYNIYLDNIKSNVFANIGKAMNIQSILTASKPEGFREECRQQALLLNLVDEDEELPEAIFDIIKNELTYKALSAVMPGFSIADAVATVYSRFEEKFFSEILFVPETGKELSTMISEDNEDILNHFEKTTCNTVVKLVCLKLKLQAEVELYDEILTQIALINNSENLTESVFDAILHSFLSYSNSPLPPDQFSLLYIKTAIVERFNNMENTSLLYKLMNSEPHPEQMNSRENIPYLNTVIPKAAAYISSQVYNRFNKTCLENWICNCFSEEDLENITTNLWSYLVAGEDISEDEDILLDLKSDLFENLPAEECPVLLDSENNFVNIALTRYLKAFLLSQQEMYSNILYYAVYGFVREYKFTDDDTLLNCSFESVKTDLQTLLFDFSEEGMDLELVTYIKENISILIENASADYSWMDSSEIFGPAEISLPNHLNFSDGRQQEIISEVIVNSPDNEFSIDTTLLNRILSQVVYHLMYESNPETSEEEDSGAEEPSEDFL